MHFVEYHVGAIYIKKASIQSVLFVKLDDINLYKTLKFCYNRTWLRLYVYLFSILFIFTLLCLLICHKMVNNWFKQTVLWWKHDIIQWRTRRYAHIWYSKPSCNNCNFYPLFLGVFHTQNLPRHGNATKGSHACILMTDPPSLCIYKGCINGRLQSESI